MPQHEEESRVPVLVSPREETVVNGRQFTLAWNPVKGASSYRVQIADSPSFDTLAFEEIVEDGTDLVVEDELSLDERTYYWRVLARDEEGRLHGEDNVESFISGTPDDEDLHLATPDAEEEYGPAARLFRGAKAEAAAELTHDQKYVDEEAELGVEHEGVEAGQILGFALATAVALGLAIFALFQYVDIVADETRFTATGSSGYPELREAELNATRQLSQYGVVDEQEGVYRIPVDRAIEIMANEARQSDGEYSSELNLRPEGR